MKFAMRVCTHAYTHVAVHAHTQAQDSLPGTRQQCVAKWDVWEPPAAKRRTGRRNKPSLMETWHARRGGNSNKRLMGHGAFSTAAKYPPLHSPLLSVLLLCPMLAEGGSAFQYPGPYPEATYFSHPFTPVQLRSPHVNEVVNAIFTSQTCEENIVEVDSTVRTNLCCCYKLDPKAMRGSDTAYLHMSSVARLFQGSRDRQVLLLSREDKSPVIMPSGKEQLSPARPPSGGGDAAGQNPHRGKHPLKTIVDGIDDRVHDCNGGERVLC